MTNCPNCGAPIVAAKCEYCGTVFSNPVPSDRYRSSREYESLISAKKLLQQQIAMEALYMSALQAMRNYSA